MAGRGQAGRSGLEPITARLRQLFFTLDAFRGLPRCLALLALDQRLPDMGASRSGADLPQPTQPAAGRSQVSQTPCASQAGVAEPRLRDSVCGSIYAVEKKIALSACDFSLYGHSDLKGSAAERNEAGSLASTSTARGRTII